MDDFSSGQWGRGPKMPKKFSIANVSIATHASPDLLQIGTSIALTPFPNSYSASVDFPTASPR